MKVVSVHANSSSFPSYLQVERGAPGSLGDFTDKHPGFPWISKVQIHRIGPYSKLDAMNIVRKSMPHSCILKDQS